MRYKCRHTIKQKNVKWDDGLILCVLPFISTYVLASQTLKKAVCRCNTFWMYASGASRNCCTSISVRSCKNKTFIIEHIMILVTETVIMIYTDHSNWYIIQNEMHESSTTTRVINSGRMTLMFIEYLPENYTYSTIASLFPLPVAWYK